MLQCYTKKGEEKNDDNLLRTKNVKKEIKEDVSEISTHKSTTE